MKIRTSNKPRITLKRCVGYLEEEVSATRAKFVRIVINEKRMEKEKIAESSGCEEMEMQVESEKMD